jgi:hypothetical protein
MEKGKISIIDNEKSKELRGMSISTKTAEGFDKLKWHGKYC